ncbi:hypothetical protein JCGZ_07303 [Jatropha curcas]|uniref:Avr9/Cf-9 rapidly elicited protein 146 n=1 Tax=Jatropha curcas TaxID=180498 RepID=A0A067KC98_JATCU|nr:uncharacterized protein LOC105637775 [Jatropha curcas]KDP33732.1 hypothetical protein JCGZ_07303 [Jatropha curcas]
MEMEASTTEVGKKLWHIVRVVFFMLRKGISKSRIMLDLHLMLKRGNKIAGKAIGNLIYHHNNSSFSCRSNDALNFISPREYEFSCSNSPAFYPFSTHKRKNHHFHLAKSYKYDDATTVAAVQKVLGMFNNEVAPEAASPMVLPGFGKSPMVRQLRITDSPFPIKDDGDSQVDKAAEEFIKKFYKDLKLQRTSSAFESPYHGMWVR